MIQWDSPIAVDIELDQVALHLHALRVLPFAVTVRQLLHDLEHVLQRQAVRRILENQACKQWQCNCAVGSAHMVCKACRNYSIQSRSHLYSTLLYSTLLSSTLLYYTLLYSTLLYSTLLYSPLFYSTLLSSTLLYYTLLYSTLLYYTMELINIRRTDPGTLPEQSEGLGILYFCSVPKMESSIEWSLIWNPI